MGVVIRFLWVVILAAFPKSLHAQGNGNTIVMIEEGRYSVASVIASIETQTYYRFSYEVTLDLLRVVEIEKSVSTISEVLSSAFRNSGYDYKIVDRYVIVEKSNRPRNVIVAKTVSIAEPTLRGVIVDEKTSSAVADCEVTISGPITVKTRVDESGSFSFVNIPHGSYRVIASAEGYQLGSGNASVPNEDVVVVANVSLKPEVKIEEQEVKVEAEVLDMPPLPEVIVGPTWSILDYNKVSAFGVKTNLLYGGATLTPNLGVEVGLGRKTTFEFTGGYNPWNYKGTKNNNRKIAHWLLQSEFRYWTCERFNGHFFGLHALYSQFNISGHSVPTLFEKEHRYRGFLAGGGLSYGYHLMLGRAWGLEFNIGAGVAYMDYKIFDCVKCSKQTGRDSKIYYGPTKAAISLIYIIK